MALPEEAAALRRALAAGPGPPPADLHVFGPGPRRAARALEGVSDRPVIHAGFAGGLRPDAPVGSLFVVRRALDVRGAIDVAPGEHARALIARGARPAAVRTVSAPLDVPMKRRLAAEAVADLVDMETAIVARSAAERDLAYTGLRIVSDGPEDPVPDCVLRSWDGERFRIGAILAGLVRQPPVLFALLELRRRARRLSGDLATHLMAALAAVSVDPDPGDRR